LSLPNSSIARSYGICGNGVGVTARPSPNTALPQPVTRFGCDEAARRVNSIESGRARMMSGTARSGARLKGTKWVWSRNTYSYPTTGRSSQGGTRAVGYWAGGRHSQQERVGQGTSLHHAGLNMSHCTSQSAVKARLQRSFFSLFVWIWFNYDMYMAAMNVFLKAYIDEGRGYG